MVKQVNEKCPECNKEAEMRILRVYIKIKNRHTSNIIFWHCLNRDCSITYFEMT